MIDGIPEASLETESAVEAAFASYSVLDAESKQKVSNFERLVALREEIADLYEDTTKRGSKIDRSKILIGTYCVNFTDDSHIKEVAECGIDFIAAASYSPEYMDTLAKYNLGAFVSAGNFGYPVWNTSDHMPGVDVGAPSFTIEEFAAFGREFDDHEAIWGIELMDEPHADEIPYLGQWTQVLLDKYPDYQVYNNLFPSYGDGGVEQIGFADEEGNSDYERYVKYYIENVNLDYVSYDHYMYWTVGSSSNEGNQLYGWDAAIENMRIVADACRETNKDYWIVVQANNPNKTHFTTTNQLRFQANTALAFGYTVINWACYNPGWFYNNICDANGNKTVQYEKVQQVNKEINTLSPVFMKYKNIDTNIIGAIDDECPSFYENDDNVINQDIFLDLTTTKDTDQSILCGYFEKRIGEGYAMMFVNVSYPYCEYENVAEQVFFKVSKADAIVTLHTADGSVILSPDAEGVYCFWAGNAEYNFVTVE